MRWLVLSLLVSTSASAAPSIKHKLRKGEKFSTIAGLYYGNKSFYGFVMAANNLDKARPGKTLVLPQVRQVITRAGDTWESLAQEYLGSSTRAKLLQWYNQSQDDIPAAGLPILVPFHVTYQVPRNLSWRRIASRFYGTSKLADRLRDYNGSKENGVKKRDEITVPFLGKRSVVAEATGKNAQARQEKRSKLLASIGKTLRLAEADRAIGDYHAMRKRLTAVDTAYLDADEAVDACLLLAEAYLAFRDKASAKKTLKIALGRRDALSLSKRDHPPLMHQVLKEARAETKADQ